jgi:hypothetical protein
MRADGILVAEGGFTCTRVNSGTVSFLAGSLKTQFTGTVDVAGNITLAICVGITIAIPGGTCVNFITVKTVA